MSLVNPKADIDRIAAKLAGPGGVANFNASIREAEAAFFPNAVSPDETEELLSLARLETVLDGAGAAVAQADIYANGHLVRLADIHHRSGRLPSEIAAEHIGKGSTLRFRDIDRFDDRVADFADSVTATFAAPVQINVYLTPPQQDGFPPHYDNTDVFIVQIAGSKQWTLHQTYTNQTSLPDPESPWDPETFQPVGIGETHTLQVGDVLYVPRGGMHSARCAKAESMHLTVSLTSLSFATLLEREVRRLAIEEEALRRRVPWSVNGGPCKADEVHNMLRHWWSVLGERIDPSRVIEEQREFLSRRSRKRANAISKMIASLNRDAGAGDE